MKSHLTRHLLATVIILGTSLASCNKEKDKEEDPKAPTEASGVYATYSYGGENNSRTVVLWKDGEETDLTNYDISHNRPNHTSTNLYTSAVSVSSQSDVFVAGCECHEYYQAEMYIDSCYTVLWKNGIKRNVNENSINRWFVSSNQTDLQIASNGDVYVLGMDQIDISTKAKYAVWKNDSKIFTVDSAYTISDMFVKGNDVYIAGNKYDYSINDYYPVLWKNGVEQKLPISSYMAKSVFVSDNDDVYVGLHNGKVLKNNVEYTLNTSAANEIHDIAAAGSDIYVLATHSGYKKAAIWKNGNIFQELEFDKPFDNIEPGAMFIKGEDIYAIGVVNHPGGTTSTGDGLNTVVIWKNGKVYEKLKEIDGLTVEAPSIFVK